MIYSLQSTVRIRRRLMCAQIYGLCLMKNDYIYYIGTTDFTEWR